MTNVITLTRSVRVCVCVCVCVCVSVCVCVPTLPLSLSRSVSPSSHPLPFTLPISLYLPHAASTLLPLPLPTIKQHRYLLFYDSFTNHEITKNWITWCFVYCAQNQLQLKTHDNTLRVFIFSQSDSTLFKYYFLCLLSPLVFVSNALPYDGSINWYNRVQMRSVQ